MITAISNSGKKFSIEKKEGVTFVNGKPVNIDAVMVRPGVYHWLVDNKSFTIEVLEKGENKTSRIRVNGKVFTMQVKDKMDDLLHELGMDNLNTNKVNDLKAPMPGLVVDIKVSEGQSIKKGDTIIVLEAMKMENALKATADATVKKIVAVKGAAVEKNEVLVFMQ